MTIVLDVDLIGKDFLIGLYYRLVLLDSSLTAGL